MTPSLPCLYEVGRQCPAISSPHPADTPHSGSLFVSGGSGLVGVGGDSPAAAAAWQPLCEWRQQQLEVLSFWDGRDLPDVRLHPLLQLAALAVIRERGDAEEGQDQRLGVGAGQGWQQQGWPQQEWPQQGRSCFFERLLLHADEFNANALHTACK